MPKKDDANPFPGVKTNYAHFLDKNERMKEDEEEEQQKINIDLEGGTIFYMVLSAALLAVVAMSTTLPTIKIWKDHDDDCHYDYHAAYQIHETVIIHESGKLLILQMGKLIHLIGLRRQLFIVSSSIEARCDDPFPRG